MGLSSISGLLILGNSFRCVDLQYSGVRRNLVFAFGKAACWLLASTDDVESFGNSLYFSSLNAYCSCAPQVSSKKCK